MPGGRFDEKINKARSGDFRFLYQLLRVLQMRGDGSCNFARRHFLGGGHQHGDIGGKITMSVSPRLIHLDPGNVCGRQISLPVGTTGSIDNEFFYFLFHIA